MVEGLGICAHRLTVKALTLDALGAGFSVRSTVHGLRVYGSGILDAGSKFHWKELIVLRLDE